MNTIVVEDDGDIRNLVVILAQAGAPGGAVFGAANGFEAHAIWRRAGADLFILDLGLPDVYGLDLLATLRREGYTGQVIVATAEDSVANRRQALELGVGDFLVKPFDARQMTVAIGRAAALLEGSRLDVVA